MPNTTERALVMGGSMPGSNIRRIKNELASDAEPLLLLEKGRKDNPLRARLLINY